MADNFNFELVSPERLLMSEAVSEVIVPGSEGELTVMAHHAPLMTAIRPGVVTAKLGSGELSRYAVLSGFADISLSGCTILTEAAVALADLKKPAVQKRIAATREELEGSTDPQARTRLEQYLADLAALEELAA